MTYVLVRRSIEVVHVVLRFKAVALECLLVEVLLQLHLLVSLTRNDTMLCILLQGTCPQSLFFVLECNTLLVVLHSMRDVRVVAKLVLLNFGQELTVLSL